MSLKQQVKQSLMPEFTRNSEIQELDWNQDKIAEQRVIVVGANSTAENIIKQLLVLGYKEVYLWSNEREKDSSSKAKNILARLNHISPYYRHKAGYESLEAKALTAGFDILGFTQFEHVNPNILINTLNNHFLADTLLSRFLDIREESGLFIDAHTIQDHNNRLYGLNIQTALRSNPPFFDEHHYIEERDLSLFEEKQHDPLMAIIAASYSSAFAIRHTLQHESGEGAFFFKNPINFTLFPFSQTPTEAEPAKKEIRYKGFFGDKFIYLAGLGGGSLILDTLIRIFDINKLCGVDRDKLERSNFNRLIPFIDEELIGKPKTEAARAVYSNFAGREGKDIKFVDGVIFDDLLIGKDKHKIDIIFGFLSGFHNKLNLVALSQKLAKEKEHLLCDVGTEPFRFDITNYLTGITPCDCCRNLYDLAVTEYISENIPNCDKYPTGSTVFANYLGVLAIIQAMKYVDHELGSIVTGSISGDILPSTFDPNFFYNSKESVDVDQKKCRSHQRTTPLVINPNDFIIEEGMDLGWHTKEIYKRIDGNKGRHIGKFRYERR